MPLPGMSRLAGWADDLGVVFEAQAHLSTEFAKSEGPGHPPGGLGPGPPLRQPVVADRVGRGG